MEFMLGCNYWDKANGTDMWRFFDIEGIERDVKMLSQTGIKYMRVFPNWRDFQPINKLYAWRGAEKGYCKSDDTPIDNELAIDYTQIENFKLFADVCNKYGIKLIVSVVTGWMSGRLFLPSGLEGKNPISDPEVLMWTARFIKGFVEGVKCCENIIMWDLGNECNCLGQANNRYEAYVWTMYVRNAIYAADNTRPISSGMHGLDTSGGLWTIKHQGEITDFLTPHPYASITINNDIEPINTIRTTILPTVQCVYYSSLSGKPTILQEHGTFSQAMCNRDMSADFSRINIFSAFVHSVKGYLWWCGANHSNITNTPYSWGMMERDLSLFEVDDTPRPIAHTIKETGEFLDSLPFKELPERDIDAVCLLAAQSNHWSNASASFVLGKQSGIEVTFAEANNYTELLNIPESDIYLLPCIEGWEVINQHAFKTVFDRVYNGATIYISYAGGDFFHFEEYTGLRSNGIVRSKKQHVASFDFGDIKYQCEREILVDSIGAEVLAYNEEGNIAFSRFNYGKGKVYFLNIPLENTLAVTYEAYKNDYYKIYQIFADDVLKRKIAISRSPEIGVTQHKIDDNNYVISALNYSNKDLNCELAVLDGWKLKEISKKSDIIKKCDAKFYYAQKI